MSDLSVGIFGGTFDPVHKGHTSIAQSFLRSGFIQELWVMLTPIPPHKNSSGYAQYDQRLTMLKHVFQESDGITISTVENTLPKPSYTVQTIRYLKNKYPDTNFMFCMGEDSLVKFHTWKYYKEILKECNLLVARRPGSNTSEVNTEILDRALFVDHEPMDISSTKIKTLLHDKNFEKAGHYLDDRVIQFIEKEQLYR